MMKKLIPFFYFTVFIIIILILQGCYKTEFPNEPIDPVDPIPNVRIPETTKILSGSDYSNYLVSISSDSTQFTFQSAILSSCSLKVNDILYIPTTTGLLRKITNIQASGNQIVISTTQGTFEEAIENGRLSYRTKLRTSQINKVTYLTDGVSISNNQLNKVGSDSLIKFNFNKIIYDGDGDTTETQDDQVRILGHFNLTTDMLFDVEVEWFKLQYARYGYEMLNDLSLILDAKFAYQIDKSIQIARITFTPINLQIGPLPVIIIPEIFVNLGIKGNANASLFTSVDNDLFLEAGIEYRRVSGWGTYQNLTDVFNFNPPQITANALARGYLAPEISMAVYGTLAAYIRGEFYSEIIANIATNPWWKLYAGLDLGVGARANLLGNQLFDYSKSDLIKLRKLIYQASGSLLTLPTVTTSTITSISSNSAISGGNVTSQGNSPVTARGVCWSTSQNPTINNSKTNNGSGTGSFTSNITGLLPSTTYYVRAYATNSAGTSYGSQISFTTSQGGTYPQAPTLSSPANAATNVSIPATLCWNTSTGATSYTLQVSTSSGFSTFVYNQSGLTGTCQDVPGLNNSTTYYWRVNASNNFGTSAWSNYRSFSTTQVNGGELKGNVYNATNNSPITSATVKLKQGSSTLSTKTTTSTGFYSFTNVSPGNYSVEVSATGYVTDTKSANVTSGGTNTLDFYLSPSSSNVDFRIVLQWEANPRDLDAHLYKGQYHIYYANKGNQYTSPYTVLDVDKTTGYGPETITIYNLNNDECKYYVHRYAGSPEITQSNAVVKVFSGNSLLKTYHVPTSGNGDWWYVFDISSSGSIIDKNIILSSPSRMIELPNKRDSE